MKTLFVLLVLLLSSVFALAQDTGQTTGMLGTFGDEMKKGNLTKIEALFNDKATVYWFDKKVFGKAALLKLIRQQISASDKRELSFSPEDGLEDNNISTSWGTFALLYTTGTTQISNQVIGRYTVIAKNIGDKWEIVSLHISSSPFPRDN